MSVTHVSYQSGPGCEFRARKIGHTRRVVGCRGSRRLVADLWPRRSKLDPRPNTHGICGGKKWHCDRVSLSASVFPCQWHSTSAPYCFVCHDLPPYFYPIKFAIRQSYPARFVTHSRITSHSWLASPVISNSWLAILVVPHSWFTGLVLSHSWLTSLSYPNRDSLVPLYPIRDSLYLSCPFVVHWPCIIPFVTHTPYHIPLVTR